MGRKATNAWLMSDEQHRVAFTKLVQAAQNSVDRAFGYELTPLVQRLTELKCLSNDFRSLSSANQRAGGDHIEVDIQPPQPLSRPTHLCKAFRREGSLFIPEIVLLAEPSRNSMTKEMDLHRLA